MDGIDCTHSGERSTRRPTHPPPQRQRAQVVLGWVTFEPELLAQLLEAEALVRRLPRDAEATALLRLAFLAQDSQLLTTALRAAQAENRWRSPRPVAAPPRTAETVASNLPPSSQRPASSPAA